ncbi:MAG: hypothetical protein K9J35_02170 [Rhodoferax sp.]|uniref:hypothetical protein n=1 Tax=Polynucleobacter sp. MG-Unter2-18 TaxID=2081052 RepID=UPI001BFEA8CD|nr:hypothetical protein [Polynucleobacter sp. MG-Unter2-18]MCF8165457.1 hypothetical protein [Rhodoferax sp.]QWD94946.1 hypothetical protein C2759_02085 [Polynucleobacter sp. MG-Unter2-18]
MENPVITEHRIRGDRFYAIEKNSKIAFYTTNIAAARYWVKNVIDKEALAVEEPLEVKPEGQ